MLCDRRRALLSIAIQPYKYNIGNTSLHYLASSIGIIYISTIHSYMSLSRICYMHETEHSASHGDECNYRRWLTPEHAPTHTLHTHTQRNSNKYKYNTYQQTPEKKKQKKMLLEAMQKIILKFAPRHLCGAGENVICHAYIHLQGLSGVLLLSLLLLLVPSLLFYFLFLFFHSLR